MNRIVAFVSLLMLCHTGNIFAFQDRTVVATIDDKPIWDDEFLYAFKKNRDPEAPVNKDSLLQYLDRYIDFKLKVQAARARGTDTLTQFINEYEGYVSQVSKPYLDNLNELEDLVDEAFERTQYEVKAAHLLIRVSQNATPADTLAAYQKTDSLLSLARNGIDFGLLARQNSADGNAERGGDLGWFTAFGMVYPFETAVYNTELGQVSNIVKTQFGYHLVKVTGKRPARGRVRTSHIFIARSQHSYDQGVALINKAYDSLQSGSSWNKVCQLYSEDQRSKSKNCALPMAGIGQLPEEYLQYAFPIKEIGTYTEPVETPFGWHIIRLDGRQAVPGFEEAKNQLAEGVKRSGRLQYGEQEVIKKLKAQYNFETNDGAVTQVLDSLKKYIGQVEKVQGLDGELLFSFSNRKLYVSDLLRHMASVPNGPGQRNFTSAYRNFEKEAIFDHEDSLALIKFPEYRLLLQEYEEGLLLFDIMEDEVWNKALEDSLGMVQYFAENEQDYQAPERAVMLQLSSRSSQGQEVLDRAKTILEGITQADEADSLLKAQLPLAEYGLLKIAKRTYTQEDLPIFDQGKWAENQLVFSETRERLYLVQDIIPAGTYRLDEIRGRVTADYQDYLDEVWVATLRKKTKVKIYKKRVAALLPLD